jgi:riboflavin transporter FmnP
MEQQNVAHKPAAQTVQENQAEVAVAHNNQTAQNIQTEQTAQEEQPQPAQAAVEEQPAQTAQVKQQKKKKNIGQKFAEYFTATRIAYMAVFTALAYVLYLFDFSLLPGTPVSFLKLDFSNVFVMIAGFALGPVSGVIVGVLKECIHALTVGNTAFVGELANILFILSYTLLPAIVYKKHKGIKVVLITLFSACLIQCVLSVPINYLLTFPAFSAAFGATWDYGHELFISVWYWAILFNFIKTLIISAAVLLLYKPLSRLIKLTNAKFVSVKQNRTSKK